MTVNIELISQTDLADESFYIAINGLEPRAMYCVEMYLSDYYCINAPLLLPLRQYLFRDLIKEFQKWDYSLMRNR